MDQFTIGSDIMSLIGSGDVGAAFQNPVSIYETFQYISERFQALLAEYGVEYSMSRSGNRWNNVGSESFFSSMNVERIKDNMYSTWDEAK